VIDHFVENHFVENHFVENHFAESHIFDRELPLASIHRKCNAGIKNMTESQKLIMAFFPY
jgi:hypothetical protein